MYKKGRLSDILKETKDKALFEELAIVKGILLRRCRVVVPAKLQTDVLKLAHMGPKTPPQLLKHTSPKHGVYAGQSYAG